MTCYIAQLLPVVILWRYTAISVVPAALGKKVRDVAAKVNTDLWSECVKTAGSMLTRVKLTRLHLISCLSLLCRPKLMVWREISQVTCCRVEACSLWPEVWRLHARLVPCRTTRRRSWFILFAYPHCISLFSNRFLKLFTWFNASNAFLRPLNISRVEELSVINNKYTDTVSICTSLVIKIKCSSSSLLERATWHHGGPVLDVYSKPMCSPGLLDFLSVFVEIVAHCLLYFMFCYDRLLQVMSVFLKIVFYSS